MLYRMKVTALIPKELIKEVKTLSKSKTITQALIIALKEWTSLKHIQKLTKEIEKKPLRFRKHFSASAIRELNRRR